MNHKCWQSRLLVKSRRYRTGEVDGKKVEIEEIIKIASDK